MKLPRQRSFLSDLSLGVATLRDPPHVAKKKSKKPARTSEAAPAEQPREPARTARKACAAAKHSS